MSSEPGCIAAWPRRQSQTLADATARMTKDAQFREKLLAMMITPAPSGSAGELEAMRTGQLANFQRALGAGK